MISQLVIWLQVPTWRQCQRGNKQMGDVLVNIIHKEEHIPLVPLLPYFFYRDQRLKCLSTSLNPPLPHPSSLLCCWSLGEWGSSAMQTQQQPRPIWPISVRLDMSGRAGSQSQSWSDTGGQGLNGNDINKRRGQRRRTDPSLSHCPFWVLSLQLFFIKWLKSIKSVSSPRSSAPLMRALLSAGVCCWDT